MSASSVAEQFTAMTWNNIAPRLGFSFDFAGDGKTVLKGSYGRYYEALLTQYFSTVNPNGLVSFYGYVDPNVNLYELDGYSLPEAGLLGYNGEEPTAPYVDEFTVSVERELFEDWSLTARGIYKERMNHLEDVDIYGVDMDELMNNGNLVWTNWREVPVTDPVTGSTLHFWEKINKLQSSRYALVNIKGKAYDYKAVELIVKKRFSKGWMFELSYVLSKLEGLFNTNFDSTSGVTSFYDNPNSHVNAVGRLGNDRRHYLKALGLVRGPWGINISGVVEFYTGSPYSRSLSSSQEGVTLNGLSSASIIVGKRGEYTLPDVFRVDLALEKQFKFNKVGLSVFAQAFNVFNSGVADLVETSTSNPRRTFGTMTSITDPFYLRIGARIDFN